MDLSLLRTKLSFILTQSFDWGNHQNCDSLQNSTILRAAFDNLDLDHDGVITSVDLLRAFSKISQTNNISQDESAINGLIHSKVGTKTLTFQQFCQLLDVYGLQFIPNSMASSQAPIESNIAGLLRDLALMETRPVEPKSVVSSSIFSSNYWSNEFDWTIIKHLAAGGVAGGVSRTVVSPFERMKILFQVQGTNKTGYDSVWGTLVKMWKEEGLKGYMRGNGTNVIRIVPYSAVQFAAYESQLLLIPGTNQLNTPRRLTAGALAGITSVVCTYPLDVVRTRLSVQSANILSSTKPVSSLSSSAVGVLSSVRGHATLSSSNQLPGIWGTLKTMYKTEGGVRALYQGLVPTLMGVAPYVALNFQSYEVLRAFFTPVGESSPSGVHKLICGALAGTIAQTFTYPLDVLRRRMQVNGLSDMLGYKYKNTLEAAKDIVSREGVKGLYKGMIPNYLKVAPSIGVSFYVYELCKTGLNC